MKHPEVSGRAFLGLIRYVKEQHGEGALEGVIRTGGARLAPAFASRIHLTDWLPYPSYVAFLHALKARFGAADAGFYRGLGAVAGKRDLGSIFKVYVALASAERLIRSSARVWPSYYKNAGTMFATRWDPEETTLRIEGFGAMATAHCQLMEGWMAQTMDTIGYRVRAGREVLCMSRGDPWHEFSCTWTLRQTAH